MKRSRPGSGANSAPLGVETNEDDQEKEQPNYELSGLLAEEARKRRKADESVYAPPADATLDAVDAHSLVVFKGDETPKVIRFDVLCVNDDKDPTSYAVVGRDKTKTHLRAKHPSVSSIHAAFQFRKTSKGAGLFLIDLESRRGTTLNGEEIAPARYVRLLPKGRRSVRRLVP